MLGPAAVPVALAHRDVGVAELLQLLAGGLREVRQDLDRVDLGGDLATGPRSGSRSPCRSRERGPGAAAPAAPSSARRCRAARSSGCPRSAAGGLRTRARAPPARRRGGAGPCASRRGRGGRARRGATICVSTMRARRAASPSVGVACTLGASFPGSQSRADASASGRDRIRRAAAAAARRPSRRAPARSATRPPTTVRTAEMPGISAAGTVSGSRESTVRSAAYPAAIRPRQDLLECREGGVRREQGQGLGAGSASRTAATRRAACRRDVLPRHGRVEPEERVLGFHRGVAAPASRAPASFSRRQAYAPAIRVGPSRASAQGMSEVACVGWIDAMTESRANRGKSSGAMTWACSIRGRCRAGRRAAAPRRRPMRTRRERSGCRDRRSRGSRAASRPGASRARSRPAARATSRAGPSARPRRSSRSSSAAPRLPSAPSAYGLDRADRQEVRAAADRAPRGREASRARRARARPWHRRGSAACPATARRSSAAIAAAS